ncbi:transcription factor S-II, central domain-containing protein [Coprinopsis sp. MPI-PUGE-AT-0042]|nr:transcription factor S-II, central domain-containing protein [Coprinopsis sp. MPI-PUGE-AT-0042]KAH6903894.1 transcription factor S-II, central domain-containing protein [Coprinopsis sp. MPI-PUGE-AT-0042]
MSGPVIELKKHVKQLQQATSAQNEGDIISILNILKNDFVVTEQILRESKAGLAVGKLRTNESVTVANLAKEVVRKWKGEVDKQKASHGSPAPSAKGKHQATSKSSVGAVATPSTPTAVRTAKSDGIKGDTGDSTRNKCMELIYDALASDSSAPVELVQKRASAIEAAVFKNHDDSTNGAYKGKIRSLFVNLKDKNNPMLREDIVSGEISPERFAVMSSEEMASDEQKAARKKIEDENLFKSLAAQEAEAETEAFQCSKCKQRKCRYRQAQTRSADEPMTTFVTCTVCGNRWKFS